MGWNMPWVSSAGSEFNFDLGYSRTEEQTRQAIAPLSPECVEAKFSEVRGNWDSNKPNSGH
jgi:predicted dithiol-disulfide oxidoreductase (DUF899 family)